MGIKLHTVKLLVGAIAGLPSLGSARLLVIGVQDCYFTYEALLAFLTKHAVRHTPVPANERELTTGFKWAPAGDHTYQSNVHARTVCRVLGFSAEHISFMDVSPYEGADILHDLNVPIPDALRRRFDVVLDFGTAEHVFSVKDCLANLAALCDLNGLLIALHPADWMNHGFYNFSAALIGDFFIANGFEVACLRYIATPRNCPAPSHYLDFPPGSLRTPMALHVIELYSVLRKRQETPVNVPMQGLYESLWLSQKVRLEPTRRTNGFSVAELARGAAKFIAARSPLFSFIALSTLQRSRAVRVGL